MTDSFDFESLVDLCHRTQEELRGRAARAADTGLAARNWLFGWYIVEYEQKGDDRAEYGTRLIERLSEALRTAAVRGASPTNLRKFRGFYRAYPQIYQTPSAESIGSWPEASSAIQQTLSVESLVAFPDSSHARQLIAGVIGGIRLGWSHYVSLLTIGEPDERRFYEIEATACAWSVRELERQIASSLYQRLALSRDKDEIRRLSRDGQVVEKSADLIKNPLVLEFLGLEEKPIYSENELETAIIDRLETFLLELCKGFLFEAEIKTLVVDDKWLARIGAAIEGEEERLTQRPARRVKELEERYARTLPELDENVGAFGLTVEGHAQTMGLEWA